MLYAAVRESGKEAMTMFGFSRQGR
jgi:hypothetical protein